MSASALRRVVRSLLMEAAASGFVGDIERLTVANRDFRRVLHTTKHLQLVVMELPPGESIGVETHPVDQFFRVEGGVGLATIDNLESELGPGDAVIIPAGAEHDIANVGDAPLKVYTLYAPPHHKDGTIHRTRADAEADSERYDGQVSG